MSRVSFDSTKKPLEELLKQAHNGVLQLPDFQRSWVWKDDGLRALLASVSRSFPVGTLMTLQTGGEVDFKPRMIEGAPAPAQTLKPDALLLDGQQRITSLYQLTMRQGVVETQTAKRQPIHRWYYLDMLKALDPEVDRLDAILALRGDKTELKDLKVVKDVSTPAAEYEQLLFPTNRLFSADEWMMGFFAHWKFAPDKTQLWLRFAKEIVEAFRAYQMPVIELDKSTSREAVCLVFEKVNTGGEKLDAFELLTAIYAAHGFDLRADWKGGGGGEGRAKRMANGIVFPKNALTQLQPTDFLQAVSLLHTLERRRAHVGGGEAAPVTGTREALLRIPYERYRALAPRIEAGFIAAGQLLFGERVYAVRDLPYQSQLVPLAVILADLGDRAITADARAKLVRWWWCGVFGELYGSATDSRFAKDVQEVRAWIEGGDEPSTVREAIFRADRLDRMTFRISAAYKGVNVLLMQIGARDFRRGQPFDQLTYFGESVDIHHIFPKKWCQDHGLGWSDFDPIVNKTPLFYKSNRIIGGSAPSTYLAKLENEVGGASELDSILRSHLIEPALLRADDFRGFYAARREALLRAIEAAMGKDAYRADAAQTDGRSPLEEEEEIEDDALEGPEEPAA